MLTERLMVENQGQGWAKIQEIEDYPLLSGKSYDTPYFDRMPLGGYTCRVAYDTYDYNWGVGGVTTRVNYITLKFIDIEPSPRETEMNKNDILAPSTAEIAESMKADLRENKRSERVFSASRYAFEIYEALDEWTHNCVGWSNIQLTLTNEPDGAAKLEAILM